jgi:hypothetical protein
MDQMQQHLAGALAVFTVFLLSFREGKEELPRMLEARKVSYQMHSSAASRIRVQAVSTAAGISEIRRNG